MRALMRPERKGHKILALKELTVKLSSSLSLEGIVNIVIDNVSELVEKSDLCVLFLVEEEAQELALKASRAKSGPASVKSKKGDISTFGS